MGDRRNLDRMLAALAQGLADADVKLTADEQLRLGDAMVNAVRRGGLVRTWRVAGEPAVNKRRRTSRYVGVSFYKSRGVWHARVQHDKTRVCVGYFDREIDAAIAALQARQRVGSKRVEDPELLRLSQQAGPMAAPLRPPGRKPRKTV